MKLLLALLMGVSVGAFIHWVLPILLNLQRPPANFLTKIIRQAVQKRLLSKDVPWLSGYLRHIAPLRNEARLPQDMDPALFLAFHGLCGLGAGIIALAAFGLTNFFICFPMALAGAAAPYIWLKMQLTRTHASLLKALPECLELLALVMQAGLDLSAGIQHYVQKGPRGPLRDLLAGLHKETQMGRSRAEALGGLAQKTTFAPLRDVMRGLVQALSLGTSLSPLLREQASLLRTQRMQIAEKKAAEAPLKLLFPLMVFIFPTVFIVLFGPVLIMLMRGGL